MDDTTTNNKSVKKRKNIVLFDGLSDAERRQIRKSQRALRQTINKENNDSLLDELREANNRLFETSVAFTREAVLDADNQELITKKYTAQMEKLLQVPRFDSLKLVQKLSQKLTSDQGFDWKTLGRESGVCFNKIPSACSFLAGALDSQVVLKKKQQQRSRNNNNETNTAVVQPETVDTNKNGDAADKLSAMEKLVRKIRQKLRQRTAEECDKDSERPQLDGIRFLCNPQSFTQTVENIFSFSFLIKKGEASMGIDENGLYVQKVNADPETAPTQSICSLTMEDWRRLTANQKETDLPHRTGSKLVPLPELED